MNAATTQTPAPATPAQEVPALTVDDLRLIECVLAERVGNMLDIGHAIQAQVTHNVRRKVTEQREALQDAAEATLNSRLSHRA